MQRLRDIEPFLCAPTTPLREVLARINELPHQFQIVVSDTRVLMGTVTDGDIRRALLAGVGLRDAVEHCMNTAPLRLTVDDLPVRLPQHYDFVPIIDADNTVREIALPLTAQREPPVCLVMAGGFGTRLGERTRTKPKPLLEVGGKPILERILQRLETAGIRTIFVSTHYLSEQIDAFVDQRHGTANVRPIKEHAQLGTAGAVGLLPRSGDSPLLVINGDIVSSIDLQAFWDFHLEREYDATIAASLYEVSVPYGVLDTDSDGLLLAVDEKPTYNYYVAAGIYCLSASVRDLVPNGHKVDMPDLLMRARERGLRVGVFPMHEYWRDVGLPDDLVAADEEQST
jgi:dTDP-glucose pyrophosphorylase